MSDDEGRLSQRLARRAPTAVVDLEMTGLSARSDRICEVAVVRAEGPRVEAEYHSLVRPDTTMSPGALAVHGLTMDTLADAPAFGEIAQPVADALGEAALVAHNVPFDLSFLQRELEEAGQPLAPPLTVDTLLMARRLFAFSRNGLKSVCGEMGVPLENHHRALDDARATHQVFHRMLEVVDPSGDVTLGELNALIDALAPNSPLRLEQKKVFRRAARERRTVEIRYQSTGKPAEGVLKRLVDPWFLRFPRIHGWCHLRQAERVFRLDRVQRVRLTDQTYTLPTDAKARV